MGFMEIRHPAAQCKTHGKNGSGKITRTVFLMKADAFPQVLQRPDSDGLDLGGAFKRDDFCNIWRVS